MERYLIIKTRDELLRIKIGQILYFEADRNYTKLLLSNGIQFTFAINIGKIEEILEKQVADKFTQAEAIIANAGWKTEGVGDIQGSLEGIERYARKGNGKT